MTYVGIFGVNAYGAPVLSTQEDSDNQDNQETNHQAARRPKKPNTNQPRQPNIKRQEENVGKIARSITVRVISGDRRGSGILISRRGNTYDVITNAHVVDTTREMAKITTRDNVVHSARIMKEVQFPNQDLVLLQFTAKPNLNYSVATFGDFKRLRIGQTIYAAGFANDLRLKENERWRFVSGKYALQLTESLEAGYSLGYSNPVRKGMSGGPVLNELGEVVGINGRHAQPLWGNPYVFATGEPVCEPLRQWMRQLSWAIPITTVYQYIPRLVPKSKPKPPSPVISRNSQLEQMGKLVLNCQVPKSSLTQLLKAELSADEMMEDNIIENNGTFNIAMIMPHLSAAMARNNSAKLIETVHSHHDK